MVPLLLLACCFSVTLAQSCSVLVHPAPGDSNHFCFRQASLRAASAMRVFANGSCQLLDSCSTTPGSITTAQCPLYMRLMPGASLLLLRTRAGTKPNAYDLITEGAANSAQPDEDALLGRPEPFMSPLMTMQPPAFSRLHVQLFDNASTAPAVDLSFRVESGDVLRAGAWFSKDRLEAAAPWDVAVMKRSDYKKFSMKGYQRRKFIIFLGESCTDYLSYMFLFIYDPYCPFDSTFINKEYYVYAPNAPANVANSTQRREAFEFRIRGEIASSADSVYVRIP